MGIFDLLYEREEKPKEVKSSSKKNVVQPVIVSTAIQPIYTPQSANMLGPDYEEFKARFRKILDDENKKNYPGNQLKTDGGYKIF